MKKYFILTTESGSDYLVDSRGNLIVRKSSKGKYQDFEKIGLDAYCVDSHKKPKKLTKPHRLTIGDSLTVRTQPKEGIKTDFKPFIKTQPIVSITPLNSEVQGRKYLRRVAALYVLENGDEYLIRNDGKLITLNKLKPEKNTWVTGLQDPDGKSEVHKDPLKIPLEHRLILAEDCNFTKEGNPYFITNPIFNSEILTFRKVIEYLAVQH